MQTTAVRMYGKEDLRLETFELPEPAENEILGEVVSDSICMSSYKAAGQGSDHKRVPNDIAENPVMIGHEFSITLLKVGKAWGDKYKEGQRYVIQPALNYKGSLDAPGYSYRHIGGDATHVIIPNEVMEMDCLLPYNGEASYFGSLSEPMSCIVGAFRASYHMTPGNYEHHKGINAGGRMAILAGAGPMGLGTVDLALHGDTRPSLLVVTDIDDARLKRAAELFPVEAAKKDGIDLRFINTAGLKDPVGELKATTDGAGFDDVFAMAPVEPVVEQADQILGRDGCLNFFAGPTDPAFSAAINFYDVHYAGHHFVGTSGGNTEDMRISLTLMEEGRVNPSIMITHVGGLNAVVDTTLNLPKIPGGKKLIYTHVDMPLTAIADMPELGKTDPFMADLAKIVERHSGLWNAEAEKYLLEHAPAITVG
ncbi:MAG: zinc-binding dehydrogenase [Spirochaeta sp.]|jgi:threonine dehydrogenase-like Zn-dependent dehydrogenase|nr:zinc-binding dehydrogenase [Spirochaeta sp.]